MNINQHSLLITLLFFLLSFMVVGSTLAGLKNDKNKDNNTISIQVIDKQFQVDNKGKKAKAFELVFVQPDGSTNTKGYYGVKNELFDVIVENKSSEAITIHWHGLIVPNNQDGVPNITQLPIEPGEKKAYKYRLVQSGTYWMHSHQRLQEQQQLSAPLIIYESKDKNPKVQDIVMFLEDFTYKNPYVLFTNLRDTKMEKMKSSEDKQKDLNDINYDAYLTNKRSLSNPEVITTKPNKLVRLRIINASSSTNYQINLGKLEGQLIAVDGEKIKPIRGNKFPIGIANRLDILIKLPLKKGAYPILGLAEGTNKQTGLILTTTKDKPIIPSPTSKNTMGQIDYYKLERKIKSLTPLKKKPVDLTLNYLLQGTMNGYIWTINKESWPNITPKKVKKGDRVEMIFRNDNSMSHPMHLHGHVFQVTEINGEPIKDGARRDTVLVQPHSTIKVQFDADNPGVWAMHCHNLYHLAAGMLTTIEFEGYPLPSFYLNTIGQVKKTNTELQYSEEKK
ncbi:MAG: copper oxidase [Legionellales bacterium]|nr:copper oxidase [Legionellales bacterium]MAZ40184.1 copper oxidase [Legionellales bacterium]